MGPLGEQICNFALLFIFPFPTFASSFAYLPVQLRIQHQLSGVQTVVVLESSGSSIVGLVSKLSLDVGVWWPIGFWR